MDAQHNPLLGWPYFCPSNKDTEEMKHSLLYLTLELETTRAAAREEIRRRDEQLVYLRLLLEKAVEEKEEALEKCQKLMLENILLVHRHLHQQQQQFKELESNNKNNGLLSLSSSDSDESIVSSSGSAFLELVPEKTLPEKGELLQAVMKAGPLLRTLLLTGPLPQWRHPPPPLQPFNIPPAGIPAPPQSLLISNEAPSGPNCRKRRAIDGCDDSPTVT